MRWAITFEKAQKTIEDTVGIKTMLLTPFLLLDSEQMIEILSFSNTMFASTMSRRGDRCVQVYVTDFEWARAFLIASRSESHETLSFLLAKDGVLHLRQFQRNYPK